MRAIAILLLLVVVLLMFLGCLDQYSVARNARSDVIHTPNHKKGGT